MPDLSNIDTSKWLKVGKENPPALIEEERKKFLQILGGETEQYPAARKKFEQEFEAMLRPRMRAARETSLLETVSNLKYNSESIRNLYSTRIFLRHISFGEDNYIITKPITQATYNFGRWAINLHTLFIGNLDYHITLSDGNKIDHPFALNRLPINRIFSLISNNIQEILSELYTSFQNLDDSPISQCFRQREETWKAYDERAERMGITIHRFPLYEELLNVRAYID